MNSSARSPGLLMRLPPKHKLKIAGDSINSAFEQMGLALPETRDGVWELMQTLTDPADIARLAQLSEAPWEFTMTRLTQRQRNRPLLMRSAVI